LCRLRAVAGNALKRVGGTAGHRRVFIEEAFDELGELGGPTFNELDDFPHAARVEASARGEHLAYGFGGRHAVAAILSLRLRRRHLLCGHAPSCSQKGSQGPMAFCVPEDDFAFALYFGAIIPALEQREMTLADCAAGRRG
jgi:hypothetical protein